MIHQYAYIILFLAFIVKVDAGVNSNLFDLKKVRCTLRTKIDARF